MLTSGRHGYSCVLKRRGNLDWEAFAHVMQRDTQTCVSSALAMPEHALDILVEEKGLAINTPACLAISKRGRIIHEGPCLIYIYMYIFFIYLYLFIHTHIYIYICCKIPGTGISVACKLCSTVHRAGSPALRLVPFCPRLTRRHLAGIPSWAKECWRSDFGDYNPLQGRSVPAR